MTGVVLVIVLVTKFLARRVDRDPRHGRDLLHDARASSATTTWSPTSSRRPTRTRSLPSRIHAIVLVSKVHKPTLRAVAYARASRPNTLEAVTVDVDDEATEQLHAAVGRGAASRSRCKVLDSPYREITKPILDYVRDIRRRSPRDVVTVYIPEYVVGRWWEQLLHNQSALRLKGRLLFTPGVMVTSVPFQLRSSAAAEQRAEREAYVAGGIRRGPTGRPRKAATMHRDRMIGDAS